MHKIILVVASAVALGAATGALAQRLHGGAGSGRMGSGVRFGGAHFGGETHFGGRPEFGDRKLEHRDFDRRFAFRRRLFGRGFGFVAAPGWPWYDDDCLSRWERTPFGWRQRLC